ncbi:uncharacterized protein LOC134675118 [Cydia fagiglandana]|uniref:uncharacterized protein LOC134675118 n=1 Tax=Cydia fagiglandana TaxID=1458189 RepID=UPI002FEE01C0
MLQQSWALLLFLAGISQVENNEERSKRAVQDRFNVLINLYKMKPLQQSNIFKTYSDNILYESNLVKSIMSPSKEINDFYQKDQEVSAATDVMAEIKENVRKEDVIAEIKENVRKEDVIAEIKENIRKEDEIAEIKENVRKEDVIAEIKENVRKEASEIQRKERKLSKHDNNDKQDRKSCKQYETRNDKWHYYERDMPSDGSYTNKVVVL